MLVFTGPLITILSGAFDMSTDPTQLSMLPRRPTAGNFEVAGQRGIWRYLATSLIVAGGALLLQVTVSVFAAYALARKRFRGQAVVLVVILATMMLPEEVIAIPLSLVMGDLPVLNISLKGTMLGMILPLGAWGFSIFVLSEFCAAASAAAATTPATCAASTRPTNPAVPAGNPRVPPSRPRVPRPRACPLSLCASSAPPPTAGVHAIQGVRSRGGVVVEAEAAGCWARCSCWRSASSRPRS
ncbi:MAG TPA: hypothetical protein VJT49_32595 [Amycolatopsis sp.]|uniref:hypothetical protein n=1 Tax=Amycolatopsis sp. TaxID=37632 RepID=UPI002B4A2F18|nr:hypothetical protein [Amycolatopsis sp.]HKS49763.1 hypothetical protein [Amycolatopsis sp.]